MSRGKTLWEQIESIVADVDASGDAAWYGDMRGPALGMARRIGLVWLDGEYVKLTDDGEKLANALLARDALD